MTPQERRRYSASLRRMAAGAFNSGCNCVGSELLWGAAAQLLLAAKNYHPEWTFDGHGYYSFAAQQLESETKGDVLLFDKIYADSLHVNFYENNLTAKEIILARRHTFRLITALGCYLDQQDPSQTGSGA